MWKARQVASRTIILSADAAAFVDQHVAPVGAPVLVRADRPGRRPRPRPLRPRGSRSQAGRDRPSTAGSRPPRRRDHRRAGLHRGHHRPRRRPRPRSRRRRRRPTTSSRSSRTCPSTCAGRWPSAASATRRRRQGAGDLRPPRRLQPRRARVRREHPVLDHRRAARRVVHRLRQQGDDPAGARPQRAPAHRRLQAHAVAARTGHRDPPDLRLPALQQTVEVLRPRPHHRMATRPDRQPESRRHCADDTTATRPTAAGPTNASAPPPSCGAARSARPTSEEADAPHPAAGGAITMRWTRDRWSRRP